MSQPKRFSFSRFIRKQSKLLLVITAALLLELISAVQYYNSRNLMEKELENRCNSNKVEERKAHFRYFYVILQIIIP